MLWRLKTTTAVLPSSSLHSIISNSFFAMGLITTSLFLAYSLLSIGSEAIAIPRTEGSATTEYGSGRGGNSAVSNALQEVLRKAHQGPLYDYPTSFTQDILPRGFHSHNDYWRPVPLYSALSYGAISIEADVWLYDDILYIGHHRSALTPERTFESLYINPLLDVLAKQNPGSKWGEEKKNGVFDTATGQTLYLFVDVKTEGVSTWGKVVEALEPLRKAGYLSTADDKTFTSGAITVIGTGGTPLQLVKAASPRHYFYDGPLEKLDSDPSITALISPVASTDFEGVLGKVGVAGLSDTQLATLKKQVDGAHAKGIRTRYWNQPSWPISMRNAIWRQQIGAGVDLLNVDDLKAASGIGYDW